MKQQKTLEILRNCNKGDGIHEAILGIVRPHKLALAG